mmetsp:Transcript_1966/g.2526  ORF Transcript_1966/g.2526 Transcript_1966/m.2526 type:complete len:171 (+) Transcript_1966:109-621(+)
MNIPVIRLLLIVCFWQLDRITSDNAEDCDDCVFDGCAYCFEDIDIRTACICEFDGPFGSCDDFFLGSQQIETLEGCAEEFGIQRYLSFIIAGSVAIIACCTFFCYLSLKDCNAKPAESTQNGLVVAVVADPYQMNPGQSSRGVTIATVAAEGYDVSDPPEVQFVEAQVVD